MNKQVLAKQLSLLLFFLGCFPALAAFLGLFGKAALICELSSHFYVEYFLILAVVVPVLLVLRKWKPAAGLAIFLVISFFQLLPFYIPRNIAIPPGAPTLSIVQSNVNTHNNRFDAVADYILSTNADVAAFEETNQLWVDHLTERLGSAYPYRMAMTRDDNFGIALFSKIPFVRRTIEDFGKVGLPSTCAQIDVGGKEVTLIGTHIMPPYGDEGVRTRSQEMQGMIDSKARFGQRYVLFGDLNCTSWSPYFTDWLNGLQVSDSRLGFGVQPSWPCHFPILRIPIDHLLTSDAFVTVERQVGPDVGSDHYPVFARLAIIK